MGWDTQRGPRPRLVRDREWVQSSAGLEYVSNHKRLCLALSIGSRDKLRDLHESPGRTSHQTRACTHNSRAQTTVHGAENFHPTEGTCALHEKLCVTSAGRKAISRQFAAVHTT